ncbi:YicC/YloC family endoribonuclease [Listeria sp. PSOL-1]|uniref:YicC/YloC family endoribonuclease n=1 Tax=Listeria sp. PSOL-1 TaxID=1844999 RepID=UPI0013D3F2A5|nr:YicC/YloC family endoribonuclease [Listeria sp. PSOL-1]
MLKSMTGFGQASSVSEDLKVTVEVKAVNHRYLECVFRMPRQLNYLESRLKKTINQKLRRGRIECFFVVEGGTFIEQGLVVDWELADHYYRFLKQAGNHYQLDEQITLRHLLAGQTHFLEVKEGTGVHPELEALLLEAFNKAIDRLDEMRSMEGNELSLHFKNRLENLMGSLKEIEEAIPEVEKNYQEKLTARLEQFVGEEFDQNTVLTELALFLEKADIREEIERLHSHVKQFFQILQEDGAIGRKLDFLIQEMNREVNTIGSKAGSLKVTENVVEMKTTLEQIREQVQNVE